MAAGKAKIEILDGEDDEEDDYSFAHGDDVCVRHYLFLNPAVSL